MTKYTCSAPELSEDQNLNISRTAPVWWQPGEIRGAHRFVRAKPSAPEIWMDLLASNEPSAFPVLVLCKRDRFSSWEAKGTSYEQPCVMTKLCSGLLRGRQSNPPLIAACTLGKAGLLLAEGNLVPCADMVWHQGLVALCYWKCVSIPGASLGCWCPEESTRSVIHKFRCAHLCSCTHGYIGIQAFVHITLYICAYICALILHLAALWLAVQWDFYVYLSPVLMVVIYLAINFSLQSVTLYCEFLPLSFIGMMPPVSVLLHHIFHCQNPVL